MLRLSPSRSRNYPYHTILTKSTLKMLHFSVHLSSDLSRALPPGLANPAAASLAAAGGVQRAVQENFLRRGGKSFWPQAAELTKVSPAGADGALVSVYRRGVALRLLGGRVQAKPGHSMALPVKRGDSDLWPREIPGLSLVRWRSGGKVRAGLAKDGRLMFTFIKAATHKPDSTVLPAPAALQQAARDAILHPGSPTRNS